MATISLPFGASLGPEAALMDMVGGLLMLLFFPWQLIGAILMITPVGYLISKPFA